MQLIKSYPYLIDGTHTQDKSRWNDVKGMSDDETAENAMSAPDNSPTNDTFWADVNIKEPNTSPQGGGGMDM